MEEPQESLSTMLVRALLAVVERDGQAATLRRAKIAQGTFDHWQKAIQAGKDPGMARAGFDKVCSVPEVRAALAGALLRRPDANATAWEAIAGELSRLMDASTGWELVRKLSAMKELDLLDGGLSALEGIVTARRRALAEKAQHAPATRKSGRTPK